MKKNKRYIGFAAFVGIFTAIVSLAAALSHGKSKTIDSERSMTPMSANILNTEEIQTYSNWEDNYTDTQIFSYLQSNPTKYEAYMAVDSAVSSDRYTNSGYPGWKSFGNSFTFEAGKLYVIQSFTNYYDFVHDYDQWVDSDHATGLFELFAEDEDSFCDTVWGNIEENVHTYTSSAEFYKKYSATASNAIEEAIGERFSKMAIEKMALSLPQPDGGNEEPYLHLENSWWVFKCTNTVTYQLYNNNYDYKNQSSAYKDLAFIQSYTMSGTSMDLQAPNVAVPANYIINVDNMQSQEQILSHVSVIDDTDPNPRLMVKSTNYSQTNRVIGTYQFVIYGIDANENVSADYTFNVIVADSTKPSNTTFGTITQPNNVQLTPDQIISKFTISDNYSSLENITKVLVQNDYSTNWTKPGTYDVVCRATDESGNYQDSTGHIIIVDKNKPSNQGSSITQPNNIKLSTEELLALFTVSDDVSSAANITKSILSDTYSNNWTKPGTYEVVCRATDEAGNYTDATSTIPVEDKTKPTLTGQTVDVQYNSKIEDLKSLFTYSDDVSSLENLVFEIISDGYTSTYNLKGNHTITARVTDEAGNSQEASTLARVVDTIKPVITAPTEITIGNSTRFTDDMLKEKIVVNDEYDGIISDYEIIDNDDYNNNYLTVGRYTKTINAADEEKNTQTLTIVYIVIDSTSPQIFYDNYMIILTEGESLTDEMIKAYASQALGVSEASILSITGDYDVAVVGIYEVSLYMMDGTVQPFTISVGELEEKEPIKWTFQSFFSANMDNWYKFNEYPAWSICAWLSWFVIGIVGLVVIAFGFKVIKKKFFK